MSVLQDKYKVNFCLLDQISVVDVVSMLFGSFSHETRDSVNKEYPYIVTLSEISMSLVSSNT